MLHNSNESNKQQKKEKNTEWENNTSIFFLDNQYFQ